MSVSNLIIPKEDLNAFIQLFVLLAEYDALIQDAMSNMYALKETLREEINKQLREKKLNQEILNFMEWYFQTYSQIDLSVFNKYQALLNGYGYFSKISFPTLEIVLQYLEE